MNVKPQNKAFLAKVGTYKARKKYENKISKFLSGVNIAPKKQIFALKMTFFDNFNKIENGSQFPLTVT